MILKDVFLWFDFDNDFLLLGYGWHLFGIPDIYHWESLPFPGIAIVAEREATAIMPWMMPYTITIKASAAP